MTDKIDPFEDVEPIETKDVDVYAFRCGECGERAVPVDGYGTTCHKAHCLGTYDERTDETYTITLSVEQYDEYADETLAN